MQIPTISPQHTSEIVAETATVWQAVAQFVEGLDQEAFHRKPDPQTWSVAENMEHLFIATKPLVKALGLPKIALRGFGKPNRPPRSYAEVVDRYQERLAGLGGAVDQKDYGPQVDPGSSMQEHLDKWQSIGAKYQSRIQTWSEEDLNKYLLPHPLLGKLHVREMLYFTIYHSYHHLRLMHERAGV